MPQKRSPHTFDFALTVKKFFLSFFVVFTFVAYAIHEQTIDTASADELTPRVTPVPDQADTAAIFVQPAIVTPTEPTVVPVSPISPASGSNSAADRSSPTFPPPPTALPTSLPSATAVIASG